MLSPGTALHAVFETAAALERAEASARVFAARAAGHAGAPRAFAELAAIAPDGLIPTPGRGAAHVARQIEHAADVVCDARELLGDEVVDAVEWAAGMTRRIASTADALDPAGAARAARRGVATVRGLVDATVDRDERWDAFRLGTFMPRSAWISALIRAAATVVHQSGNDQAWLVAGAVAGLTGDRSNVAERLVCDRTAVATAAYALDQTEVGPACAAAQASGQHRLRCRSRARRRRDFETPRKSSQTTTRWRTPWIASSMRSVRSRGQSPLVVAEPGSSPFPGLRRPLPAAGTIA